MKTHTDNEKMKNQNLNQVLSTTAAPGQTQKPVIPKVRYHPSILAATPGSGARPKTRAQKTRPAPVRPPQAGGDSKAVGEDQENHKTPRPALAVRPHPAGGPKQKQVTHKSAKALNQRPVQRDAADPDPPQTSYQLPDGAPPTPEQVPDEAPPTPEQVPDEAPPTPEQVPDGAPPTPEQVPDGAPPTPEQVPDGAPRRPDRVSDGAPPTPEQVPDGAPRRPDRVSDGAPPTPEQVPDGAPRRPDRVSDGAPPTPEQVPDGAPRRPDRVSDGAPPTPEQVPPGLGVIVDQSFREAVEVLTRGQRTNQDWFAWRKNRITASVAHSIAHCRFVHGKSRTPPTSYLAAVTGEGRHVQTRAMSWGVDKEAEVVQKYQTLKSAALGRPVSVRDCGLFIDPQRPWLAASPDGIVTDSRTGQWLLCLEVKCPYKHKYRRVEDACKEDRRFCLEIQDQDRQEPEGSPVYRLKTSHSYYTQIQCQLAMTGLQEADLVVFTLKETAIVPVTFDPILWAETVSKLQVFYRDAVLPHLRQKRGQQRTAAASTPET